MTYVNTLTEPGITLIPPTPARFAQTFDVVFSRNLRHPESKSPAPDGTPCKGDTCGLLGRHPVTVSGLHLIGKETERGWEESEDVSKGEVRT